MSNPKDLRKVKDLATRAVEKRQYGKAAELYVEIAQAEDDPDWRQRAGEAFRKAGNLSAAAEQLVSAVEGYAQAGFLLKAIAVCKVVLQLDPRHTDTQRRLAELYAQREGRTQADRKPVAPPPVPAPPPAPEPPAQETFVPAPAPRVGEMDAIPLEALGVAAILPPLRSAPMDALPLATVLGGRKSAQFAAVSPDGPGEDLPGVGYEIALDDAAIPLDLVEPGHPLTAAPDAPRPAVLAAPDEPGPRLDPLPLDPEPLSPALPSPAQLLATAPPADEVDFSGLLDDAPPAPRPIAVAPPSPEALLAAPPRPELPRIPLFSSLTPEALRTVIEGVEVRDFAAGETLVRQGDPGVALYVVVRGQVAVVAEGPPRRQLALLGEGAFFGELALLTDFPRSATILAHEDTQVLEISRELIARVIAESPEVLKVLLRFFRERMVERLVSTSPVFHAFSAEDARRLVERFKLLELEPRTRVVREGERAPGLFLLLCGEAHVVQGRTRLARLEPGDLFGEMSLLGRRPAVASVDTETKTWVLELPREAFQEIMLTYPQLLEYVSELADRRRAENLGADRRVDFL